MTLRTHRRVAGILFLATGSICQMSSATTHTWIGAAGTWGDATQWAGSPNPPNTTSAEVFLGNNGTISLAGGTFNAAAAHIGHIGANRPGTGALIIDGGKLSLAQNVTIGEGNAGTLIINGGNLATAASKNFWLGGGTLGTGTAYVEISSGTLTLNNKAGITPWTTSPGVSTINMSGGSIDFQSNSGQGDNADTILAGHTIFSGGTIARVATITVNEISGNGVILLLNNSSNAGLTIDQSIDTTFDGTINNTAPSGGPGGASKFTKSGTGNLTLGPDTIINTKTAMTFNGGTVKVNKDLTFDAGSFIFNGGTLDLNGFAQAGSFLSGNGTVKLGNGGSFSGGPGSSTTSTFDGLITGTGTFTKQGAGTLVLTASQEYVGNTTVNSGALFLSNAGSNPLANSQLLTVSSTLYVTGLNGGAGLTLNSANSQVLATTGRVTGNVTAPSGTTVRGSGTYTDLLNVSGTIGTSNSVGTMNVGSLTLNNASVNIELNATSADKIVVTNPDALTLNGSSTITLTALAAVTAGTYTIMDYNGNALADGGHLALASPTLGSFNVSLQYNAANTSIDLSVVSNVTNATWNFNGDGNASDSTKWDGGVPNGIDQTANFTSHGGTITASPTVTLDTDVTLGTISFDHAAGSYTIAGGGTSSLILDVTTGQATVNVISGNHTISAPVVLNKDLTINATGSISFTGAVTASGKAITKTGAGAAQFENVRAGSLTVSGGALRISVKGSPDSAAGTSVVNALSVTGGSIDLANNAMVVNYSTLGTLPSDVRSALQSGRLTTSLAASGHALGYADNATLGRSTFGGQTVGSTSFLIAYTFAGDANLDGKVNGLDFNALATNFGQSGGSQVWINGDFDYNGIVDTNDFTLLGQNFNSALPPGALPSGPVVSLGTLVPEPSVTALAAIGIGLFARRRRT